jgi:hypothetical protein
MKESSSGNGADVTRLEEVSPKEASSYAQPHWSFAIIVFSNSVIPYFRFSVIHFFLLKRADQTIARIWMSRHTATDFAASQRYYSVLHFPESSESSAEDSKIGSTTHYAAHHMSHFVT